MRPIRCRRALIVLLASTALFSACAATVSDDPALRHSYSELLSAEEMDGVAPSMLSEPSFLLSGDAQSESAFDEAAEECVRETASAAERAGEYVSVHSDGALLTVTEDDSFLYQAARRYTYLSEPSFAFDLVFRVTGALQKTEEGLQLIADNASVACTSLTNGTEAEKLLAQNYLYSMYGLELNERMLSGQELSLDEFIGNGTFAQLLSAPVFVTLNADARSFALSNPLFGDWISGNAVFAG